MYTMCPDCEASFRGDTIPAHTFNGKPCIPGRFTFDGEPLSILTFIEENAETMTADDIAAIRALRPGESIIYGGGAAATFTLTRVE